MLARRYIKRGIGQARRLLAVWLVLLCVIGLLPQTARADSSVRIYVMSYNDQDAIILESDGRFAMVDSGEDNDYPDGSDSRYPARYGITVGQGHEDEVINYLYALGATADNFDFYIGTHAHSDHIGSADEVIREFCPSRVYAPSYKDAYIANKSNLFDNQYVYDNLVRAAKDVGATYISKLSWDGSVTPKKGEAAYPSFSLGSATVTIVNWDHHPLKSNAYNDANDYCWGVLVEAGGRSAFLAGDINNVRGDETRIANQLGHVDVLKLGHHGVAYSNDSNYIRSITPSVVLQTGQYRYLSTMIADALCDLGCQHFVSDECAAQGKQAMMVEMSSAGIYADGLADTSSIYFREGRASHAVIAVCNGIPTAYAGEWTNDTGQTFIFDDSPYGVSLSSYTNSKGSWRRTSRGWWWQNKDGSYPANKWMTINGSQYYFDANGYMKTGWLYLKGVWYYLGSSGSLCTGWQYIGGYWYYLDPKAGGAMRIGLFTVGGTRYAACYDGVCPVSSWVRVESVWYLTNSSCAVRYGWAWDGNAWYYLDPDTGIMQKGWLKSGGKWYYLTSSGDMVTGWRKIDGVWYWFDSTGAMKTGWVYDGSYWYYMDSSGAMQTGWITVGKQKYYLSSSGAMVTGWRQLNGLWYYFDTSGAMKTGWVSSGSAWYWLDTKTGAMLTSAWTPDGCYVNANGAWVKGKTR